MDIVFEKTLQNAKELNTDLLEMSEHENSCPICSKYEGRVFSISGMDKRFPKLPDIVLNTGKFHDGCRHIFFPFIYGISKSNYGYKNIIEFSNRPFTDNTDKSKYKQVSIPVYTMEDYKNDVQKYSNNVNKRNKKLFHKNISFIKNILNKLKKG